MECLFIAEDVARLRKCYTVEQFGDHRIVSNKEFLECKTEYQGVKYIFSTWGMICLSEEEIKAYLPNLQAVFYGAGTVWSFAEPFMKCGVRVFSAWAANAIPAAEFAAAQIVLANKGFFQQHKRYQTTGFIATKEYTETFSGNYDAKVGLLGLGRISEHVLHLLKPYQMEFYVYSNHLSEKKAAEMGIHKASIDYIFEHCQTISNHMANKLDTVKSLNYSLFSKMLPNTTFINTGRGAQVNEADLIRAMKEEPNRTALLDVTDPNEPLSVDDPLRSVENILITPHRAGSVSKEIFRMGAYMTTEYQNYIQGKELKYEVTLEQKSTMA